jgi:hypothetical protein
MSDPASPPHEWQAGGASTERILVVPALAEQWLARSRPNRPLRRHYVTELAGMMKRSEWVYNGEAIRFDHEGYLIDGQHRLLAVIEADQPADMLILHGLDRAAQDTVDRGLRRTLGDTLVLHGVSSGKNVAAALTWIYRAERNAEMARKRPEGYPSPAQILDLWDRHPGVKESARIESMVKRAPFRYSPSLAVALHYEMTEAQDVDTADRFFDQLVHGAQLGSRSPILLLRNYLIRNSSGLHRHPDWVVRAYTIKAWSFWLAGRDMRLLSFKPRQEPYPKISGGEDRSAA